MIHGLNFGSIDAGNNFLFMSDVIEGAHYVMAPKDGSEVHVFGTNSKEVKKVLTFDWFKANYICKEHPEHCQ